MHFEIKMTSEAEEDLNYFRAYERGVIVDGMKNHLRIDADKESKRRKRLRPNPIAPFELRIDNYRVFYDLEDRTVWVISVGWKEHNDVYIRGKKVIL